MGSEVMRPDDEADDAELNRPVQLPAVMDERPRGAIEVAVHRNEPRIFTKIKAVAAAAGTDFFYRFPVKEKNPDGGAPLTKWIEGPSIKAANAVARIYGNNATRIRSQDCGDYWVFTAQFYDFETGYVLERQFQQRKDQKVMKTDRGRQLDILFQIGQSKAIRNVICNALSEFTDFAEMEAKNELVTKVGKDLPAYRKRIEARLLELKVDVKRVEAMRGRSLANFLAPDIAAVIAEIQSINDGMSHADEMWPLLEGPTPDRPKEEKFDPETGEIKDDKPATGAAKANGNGKPAETAKPAEAQAQTQSTGTPKTASQVTPNAEKAKEPEPAKAPEPELTAEQRKEQAYQDHKKDCFDKVTKAPSVNTVDSLEEELKSTLRDEDQDAFTAHCAKKARALMDAGNKTKKK